MLFGYWLHHNPNDIPNPVPPGYMVYVIDNEDNLLKGWSEEFDWSWKVDPLGNIMRYMVVPNDWVEKLKKKVQEIPDKGRTDILISE